MVHHKAYVREKTLKNEPITGDTFIPPSDFRNSSSPLKRANELW